jgi:endonuclease III related protein
VAQYRHVGRRPSFNRVFQRLFAAHGPQHWWPGDTPFEIMVGAVLTQNTAWSNVEKAIHNLKEARALSPRVISAAHPKKLAAWLRPSGYFNVKSKRLRAFCRWLIEYKGIASLNKKTTKWLRRELLAVHGIGPETADDILLYAFNRPVFVIDAYTRRLFKRLGWIEGNESYEVLRALFEKNIRKNARRYNEYHALIVWHGKHICRIRPACDRCCLARMCPSMCR